MQNPIEIKGYWWLPSDSEKKLPGTLTFSKADGGFLETVGVFGTKLTKEIEQPQIILGISQAGKPITLFKCSYNTWSYPLIGLGGARYYIKTIFEGVHFNAEEEIKFNQLCAHYANLDAWVDIYGFKIENRAINKKFISNVQFEIPDSQFFSINEAFEAGIGFSSHGPNQSIVQTEMKISQRTYLVIKSANSDVEFSKLYEHLSIFSNLLQIAIQEIPSPTYIFGFSEINAQKLENSIHYPEINIYYQPIETISTSKNKLPQEFLFTFKDLNPEQIINWFNLFEKHKAVFYLYRSLFYSNKLFIENKFLNIVQALESLHSILFDNFYFQKEEFIRRRDNAIQNVPTEEKEWVAAALNSANYKRFKLKIYELLKQKESLSYKFIDDLDLFSSKIRDTRNEYVHHNHQKLTFRNSEELLNAINFLTILFEAYLLETIGFSDEKSTELLNAKIQTSLTGWKHLRSK